MSKFDALLEQLHDIEGLDPISPWPLATGWWIVIALGILILSLAVWYLIKWILFRRSWRYDTLQKLNYLSDKISIPSVTELEVQNAAIHFSEYLRRIAIRRFSRKECAGLTGEAWLEWLAKHDSKNFDWMTQGKTLIQVPYASANHGLTAQQLKVLIQAAKEWVYS